MRARAVSVLVRALVVSATLTGALVGTTACGGTAALSMRPAPRAFTPEDYERLYAAWTRDENGFELSKLQDTLHVSATFQSWEHRWAYIVRYASDYSLDTAERTELLRASLADAETTHRFFVTIAGHDWRESDLTSERAAWRVVLVDDRGATIAPTELVRVPRPGANERGYYHITPFRQAFRLAFPARRPDGSSTIAPDAHRITLRFTGPEGTVDLVWELEPTEPAPRVIGR